MPASLNLVVSRQMSLSSSMNYFYGGAGALGRSALSGAVVGILERIPGAPPRLWYREESEVGVLRAVRDNERERIRLTQGSSDHGPAASVRHEGESMMQINRLRLTAAHARVAQPHR